MGDIGNFVRWTCLVGMRSRMTWLVSILTICLLLGAWLAAAFSARQPLVVALDVGISGVRLSLLFLGLAWVNEFIGRDIERKNLFWVLGLPISRASYLAGRVAGILALLAISSSVLCGALVLLGTSASWGYASSSRPFLSVAGVGLVMAGIWLEVLLVTFFALCIQAISRTPFLPMVLGLAFAIAGRGMHGALNFLLYDEDAPMSVKAGVLPLLQWIQWLIPDLSRLDFRTALLYDLWPEPEMLTHVLMASGLYLIGLYGVAIFLFSHRQMD